MRDDDRARRPANRESRPGASNGGIIANRFLGALPPDSFDRIVPHLRPLHLERKETVFRSHEWQHRVIFPETAIVSLVSRLESGETLEVSLIGSDGFVGFPLIGARPMMPCEAIVQIAGTAYVTDANVLRRLVEVDRQLEQACHRFVQRLLFDSIQTSTCNMFHPVEQRCIKWLLLAHDLLGVPEIPLTHELLATMLGAHRPTVSLVLQSLHRAGLITEGRGRVYISDRQGLERACCECYQSMQEERRRVMTT